MKMNSIKIKLDVGGQKFDIAYDAPDVQGEIKVTDLNLDFLDEHLRKALRPVIGRVVLRSRQAYVEVSPIPPKPAAKRTAVGAL